MKMSSNNEKNTAIILCNCGGKIVPETVIKELQKRLKFGNVDIYELKDLCAVAVNNKSVLEDIEKWYNEKIVIACYARAVKAIVEQNGIGLSNYRVVSFRVSSINSVIEEVKVSDSIENKGEYKEISSTLKVPAWYPVIDKTKCTLCGKCAEFCLFGVYEFDKRELKVVNPLSCKNNCPACGRACPSSAIIFPKLPEKSMISGANNDNLQDISKEDDKLLTTLENRNAKRKFILQGDVINKAYEERKIALEKSKKNKK